MAVSIEIKRTDIVKRRMRQVISELSNSPTGMRKIAYLGIRDIIQHFNKSQGPGYNWLPLKHRDGKPLMDTGLLRNSNRYQIKGNSVLLFNNTKYGKYHQYGASKIFLPKREFMWLSDYSIKMIAKAYAQIIVGAF